MALVRTIPFFFMLYLWSTSTAQPLRFAMPLKGTQGHDFFIDNYVDHDTTKGIRDGFCGTKTYDGHNGADMLIRSFKTMDSGVYVYAAADGIVIKTHDGEYDRNKRWIKGLPANRIGILHKDGFVSYYLHLMKNSLMVKMGDSVKAGQPIGKVGSSGFSSAPHLHFEVRDSDDHVVDPFAGPCNERESMWLNQPAYDTAQYVIEQGFAPYRRNYDSLSEHYLVRDTFYIGQDTTIEFWVFTHGRMKGKTARAEWYKPSGHIYRKYDFVMPDERWHTHIWPWINMPVITGRWRVRLFINDEFVTEGHFYVLPKR